MNNTIPWKETLLIILLIALSMSMNQLQLRENYIRDINDYKWVRFAIFFCTAFTVFSLDIDGTYSLTTRAVVSAVIAFIVQQFIAANMTVMPLILDQPVPQKSTN